MAVTSPGLVIASNKAIIEAQRGIAFAKQFATDFSAELQGVGKTVAVPVFSGDATVFDSANNDFETTDGSIIPVNVTLDQLVKVTFKLGMTDLLEVDKSATTRNCGIAGGRAVSRKIEEIVMGLLTYTNAQSQFAQFTVAKLGKALAAAEKAGYDPATCVVILDPDTYGDLLDANVNNAAIKSDDIAGSLGAKYGCKAILCSAKVNAAVSSSATSGGVGFIVPDAAIAIAGRAVEQAVEGLYNEYDVTSDEASGLAITSFVHGAAAKNSRFINVAALLGAKLTYASNNKAPRYIQLKNA